MNIKTNLTLLFFNMKKEKKKKKVDETSKNNSSWGGPRKGAGRPEGQENEATKDKRIVQEEIKQRVLRSSDSLITSQMTLAKGIQMLYRIDEDDEGKKSKPILIESQEEIESYLAGEYEGTSDYYFITTERPDNKALDSLLDRTFGKARQNIGIDGGEDGSAVKVRNLESELKDWAK